MTTLLLLLSLFATPIFPYQPRPHPPNHHPIGIRV